MDNKDIFKHYKKDKHFEREFELFLTDPKKEKLDGRVLIYSEVSNHSPNFFFGFGGDVSKLKSKDYDGDFKDAIKYIKRNYKKGFGFANGATYNPDIFREIPGDKLISDYIHEPSEIEDIFRSEILNYVELYNRQSGNHNISDALLNYKSRKEISLPPFSAFELSDIPGYTLSSLSDVFDNKLHDEHIKLDKDKILDYIYMRYILEGERKFSILNIYEEFSSPNEGNINEIQSLIKDLIADGSVKQVEIKNRDVMSHFFKIN